MLKSNKDDDSYWIRAVGELNLKIERLKTENAGLKAENDKLWADVEKRENIRKEAEEEVLRLSEELRGDREAHDGLVNLFDKSETENKQLRKALQQWQCSECGGSGKVAVTRGGEADYTCSVCSGYGIHPTAHKVLTDFKDALDGSTT